MLAMLESPGYRCNAFIIGADGKPYTTVAEFFGQFGETTAIGDPIAPRGAAVALSIQSAQFIQATAAVVDNSGQISIFNQLYPVTTQFLFQWSGPFKVGPVGLFVPGGGIALAKQTSSILTALAVGFDGRLYVSSVTDGPWQAPVSIGDPIAPPGAQVALANQTSNILTGIVIGNDGRFHVTAVTGTGAWSAPVPFGDPVAPPGAPVAIFKQTDNILTAVVIGTDGRFWITSVTGAGAWTTPVSVGDPVALPGASVALAKQTPNILVAAVIGKDGRFWITSVDQVQAWKEPVPLGFVLANPGAPVALCLEYSASSGNILETRLAAMALGNDGQLYSTFVDGTGVWADPTAIPLSNVVTTGTIRPTYKVMTILYAPPGTNGGKSLSVVDYSTSSSAGTTTTISSSFKDQLDVSVQVGPDPKVTSLGAGGEFSASATATDTSSLDVKKTNGYDLKISGPASDGISHDHDIALLWLNPRLDVTVDSWENVKWDLAVDGLTMALYSLYFGWLRDRSTMPAAELAYLNSMGLTDNDFVAILALNPFATGSNVIDTVRFQELPFTFPYSPPFSASDPVLVTQQSISSTTTQSKSVASTTQYTVAITVSANIVPFLLTIKETTTLQWTDSSTYAESTASTQSATATVGGPSFGYTGPSMVKAYLDTVYNTFLFSF